MKGTAWNLVRLARPPHWIKNVFVLAAIVFGRRAGDAAAWTAVLIAAAGFCLASSAVYAFNDVLDRRQDARHPLKRDRPVASGAVGPATAVAFSLVLAAGGMVLAVLAGPRVPWVVGAYLVLMAAYTAGLKRVAILDVLVLACGFLLRAEAGGLAAGVEVSQWLLLCTLTLSLFLGFAKREAERAALGDRAGDTRAVAWTVYTRRGLEQMMTISAGLAIVTYMLYTVSPRTLKGEVGHPWLFVTVLPVVYAVFRFYSLTLAGRVTGPVDTFRRDPPFVVALLVWLGMVAAALYGL
ncbi:MAG: UbiA prenyltransferase family protein [Phycisphaerae bacterium]